MAVVQQVGESDIPYIPMCFIPSDNTLFILYIFFLISKYYFTSQNLFFNEALFSKITFGLTVQK